MTTTTLDPSPRLMPAAPAPGGAGDRELVIQPKRGWIAIDWAEMFRYRELLFFLVWRDVKVRYKQSILGVAWAVIVPVMNMLIFTVIFHVVLGIGKDMTGDDGHLIPYAIFVYTALLRGSCSATRCPAAACRWSASSTC